MSEIMVTVNFTSEDEKSANGFISILRQNIEIDSDWHETHEQPIIVDGNQYGSYWTGFLSMSVGKAHLNTVLEAIDALKIAPGTENIHPGVKVEVLHDAGEQSLKLHNKYLHNRLQDMERVQDVLLTNNNRLTQYVEKHVRDIKALGEKYAELQTYLHSRIDLTTLLSVVKDTALQVDEDLLDKFKVYKIH